MQASPLQLEHYFLAESWCQAASAAAVDPNAAWPPPTTECFHTDIQMFRGEQDPNIYRIQLAIETVPEPESPLPYQVRLQFIGYFQIDPDFEHPNREHLIQINGASVLYSAARDFLLTLTARGPWGPMMLPTVNFRIGRGPETRQVADSDD